MPGTALVLATPAPDSDDAANRRAERFLEHVAALSPEAWGRLDAIGARQTAPDLWGALARTRAVTGGLESADTPAPLTVLVGVSILAVEVGRLVVDTPLRALGIDRRAPKWMRRPVSVRRSSPGAERGTGAMVERLQRLWDLAAAQPGGVGPAVTVLAPALVSVAVPTDPQARLVESLYAPVEPFIPFASLE